MNIKYLLLFCLCFTTASCFRLFKDRKILKGDTWTGRFAKMFYSIEKDNDSILHIKKLSERDIKLLERDLNYILSLVKKNHDKLNKQLKQNNIPRAKVIVVVDEIPNMSTLNKDGIIFITTGLIQMTFAKSFPISFKENQFGFWEEPKDNIRLNSDSCIANFLNILYNHKFGKINVIKEIFEFDSDYGEEDDDIESYSELTSTISFCDKELVKILTFLLSHEFYHLITDKISHKNEIEADSFAILQYYRINKDDDLTELLFPDLLGRGVPEIFDDLFSDSIVLEPNLDLYLPYDIRAEKMNRVILEMRIKYYPWLYD